MLEVFIPIKVNNSLEINYFSDKFKNIVSNSFGDVEINKFNSKLIYGIYLNSKKLDKDLIILLNGEFGVYYFLDYDALVNGISSFGTLILKPNDISNKIKNIYLDFEEIILELNSSKLLTNTKKEKIKDKIDNVFFMLSGILFLLYKLKNKTESNLEELNSYDGLIEYEGQASLLSETSKTKKIELEATIIKLEDKVEMFLNTINSLFLK